MYRTNVAAPKGAEMARGLAPDGGDEQNQTGLSRISQGSPCSVEGRRSFETPYFHGVG